MNIKNSWKEFRIWLGWAVDWIMLSFLLLIVAAFILAGIFRSPVCIWVLLPLAVIVGILLCISNEKKPYNWRLVIKDANDFQKKFGQSDKIKFWICRTKQRKDGMPLHKIVTNLREIKQLEIKRDILIAKKATIPVRVYNIETRIKILKDEIE
jgi:membrane protein YdbS with pleckstrin-like domain